MAPRTKVKGRAKKQPSRKTAAAGAGKKTASRKAAGARKSEAPARKVVAKRRAAAVKPVPAEVEVKRLRRTRSRLERQLTGLVREIGALRTFEARVRILEGELAKRDAEMGALRGALEEHESREAERRSRPGGAESPQGRLNF
jgi:hypothetical protein